MIKGKLLVLKPEEKLDLSLSVSKIKTFKDCKAKYRFQYIEKLPKKDWQHLSFGKYLHEILETFHRNIIKGTEDPTHINMSQCFKAATANWKEKLTPEDKKEAWSMMNLYLQQLADITKTGSYPKIIDVERNFYINIDGKILLNGFIDRVQLDPDDIYHVADYKTSKSKTYLKKDFLQLLTYAYVLCLENPELKVVRGSYIMLRHNFEMIVRDFKRDEILKIEKKFIEYANAIQEEKLWRPKTSKLCEYCDFAANCPEGTKFIRENSKDKDSAFGVLDW